KSFFFELGGSKKNHAVTDLFSATTRPNLLAGFSSYTTLLDATRRPCAVSEPSTGSSRVPPPLADSVEISRE
ncbi:hypothetical protein, partial [Nocardia nova]|uniref:hypothetical protein n=1 Tax=Nocardia nova TaxID=37330 RepID=UPI001CA58D07